MKKQNPYSVTSGEYIEWNLRSGSVSQKLNPFPIHSDAFEERWNHLFIVTLAWIVSLGGTGAIGGKILYDAAHPRQLTKFSQPEKTFGGPHLNP